MRSVGDADGRTVAWDASRRAGRRSVRSWAGSGGSRLRSVLACPRVCSCPAAVACHFLPPVEGMHGERQIAEPLLDSAATSGLSAPTHSQTRVLRRGTKRYEYTAAGTCRPWERALCPSAPAGASGTTAQVCAGRRCSSNRSIVDGALQRSGCRSGGGRRYEGCSSCLLRCHCSIHRVPLLASDMYSSVSVRFYACCASVSESSSSTAARRTR